MKILFVDDDPIAREVLGEFLRDHGHEVRAVADWVGLMRELGRFEARVVLLDFNLPAVRGEILTSEIRATAGDGVKILLVSGLEKPQLRRRAREVGADGFYCKGDPDTELLRLLAAQEPPAEATLAQPPRPLRIDRPTAPTQIPWQKPDVGGDQVWLPEVLAVDDSDTRLMFLRDWLTHRGFPVQVARNGEEALEKVQALEPRRPLLVIASVSMGGIDGHKLLASIKQDASLEGVEVLLHSELVSRGREPDATSEQRLQALEEALRGVIEFEKLEKHVARRVRSMRAVRRLHQLEEQVPDPDS